MTKTAPTLEFAKVPIVGKDGNVTWPMLQWFSKIETKTNAALSTLGLNPNAPIDGTGKTVGGATQNLTANGMLQPPGVGFSLGNVPGQLAATQVGFTLDSVPDGAIRFAVDKVDAAKLAIINFASAHLNKILDNIADGVTYQRFTRVFAGQVSLPTSLIAPGTAATVSMVVPGILSTDSIEWAFSSAPASGYPSLSVIPYITTGNANFSVGNPSAVGVTPGAQMVNFMVIR